MAMHRTRTALPAWEPRILTAEGPEGAELRRLLDGGARFVDTLAEQLTDLLLSRAPDARYTPEELADVTEEHLAGVPLASFGRWVHYPWLNTVVRVLPEDEFAELRSHRNRHRVTGREQEELGGKTIAVLGLAAGQTHAVTMAQEGVGRTFRLADPGRLSLSDLNRARSPVTSLGLPKTVIAAREMYQLDPYLSISLWPDGVTEDTLDDFLTRGGVPDLLIEKCDDPALKTRARERARSLGVPVVADPGACGLLDVERFDLEPDRPVLHGLLDGDEAGDAVDAVEAVDAGRPAGTPPRDPLPYTLRLLDGVPHGPRFSAGLLETGHTLTSGPRLASGVALGAALVTEASRRILLDEFRDSGRYRLDLDALLRDGTHGRVPRGRRAVPPAAGPCPEPSVPPLPGTPLTEEGLHRLVAYGTLAPSLHNAQPWRFRTGDRLLSCELDPVRRTTRTDPHGRAALISLGAVVTNIEAAAAAAGHACLTMSSTEPDTGEFAALLSFSPGLSRPPGSYGPPGVSGELAAWITRRATHRGPGDGTPVPPGELARLEEAALARDARLHTLTDPAAIEQAGRILGEVERTRLLTRCLHTEWTDALRWTPDDAEAARDGLDVRTLVSSPGDLATLRLAADWRTMAFLRSVGGGGALEGMGRLVGSSPALCCLSVPDRTEESWFRGGRILQQLWLTATAAGLALHPVSAVLHLLADLERESDPRDVDPPDIRPWDAELLRDRMRDLRALFGLPADDAEIAVFRLHRAGPPAARALRRPPADFLV